MLTREVSSEANSGKVGVTSPPAVTMERKVMMDTHDEPSLASQMIRLFTQFPCAGTRDHGFEVQMPLELSEASYKLVVAHVEFRRKCMNQGFNNLLELLALHHDAFQKACKAAEAAKGGDVQ